MTGVISMIMYQMVTGFTAAQSAGKDFLHEGFLMNLVNLPVGSSPPIRKRGIK
jgi:hypothetical protein